MDFHLNLDTETVNHAFPAEPLCVSPEMSLREVFLLLKKHNRGNVMVCRDERLVGIFTERDALRLMARGGDLDATIESVMIRKPVTLAAEQTVGEAITMMAEGGYRRLPIVDGEGKPVGELKADGILRFLVEHFPKVVYTLPPEPHHTTQEREGA